MDTSRWMLFAGILALLAITAGCVSDDVVYVDEQGQELAVDEDGQPLTPPLETYIVPNDVVPYEQPAATGAPVESSVPQSRWVPPATERVRPAPSYAGSSRDAGAGTSQPKPAPNWDLPPAGAATSPLDVPPAKPKVSGVSLAKPPQPSPKTFGDAPAKKAPAKKAPAKKAPVKKAPAKKVDSSSALDLPPAG